MIASREISVVLQGPVRLETPAAVELIRRQLPESELILSTWLDEPAQGLSLDKIVRSEAPPAFCQHKRSGTLNNLSRLIRSTQAGIACASRPYILKIRSDMLIENTRFLETFESQYPKRGSRSVLKHKVLIPVIYSRFHYRNFPTPFHFSDWGSFGLAEDIRLIHNSTPEPEEPCFTEYFLGNEKQSPYGPTTLRMAPEQYAFWCFYQRHFNDVHMKDCSDISPELIEASDDFLVSNFIVADYAQTGWHLPKYPQSKDAIAEGEAYFGLLSQYPYELRYEKYCDPEFEIADSPSKRNFDSQAFLTALYRLKKHIGHLQHADRLIKRIEQLFVIPFLLPGVAVGAVKAALKIKPQRNE